MLYKTVHFTSWSLLPLYAHMHARAHTLYAHAHTYPHKHTCICTHTHTNIQLLPLHPSHTLPVPNKPPCFFRHKAKCLLTSTQTTPPHPHPPIKHTRPSHPPTYPPRPSLHISLRPPSTLTPKTHMPANAAMKFSHRLSNAAQTAPVCALVVVVVVTGYCLLAAVPGLTRHNPQTDWPKTAQTDQSRDR